MHHAVAGQPDLPAPSALRTAGWAIAIATILSTLAVALDGNASGANPQAIMQSMVALRATKGAVHTVAIMAILAYAFGYTVLARQLDLRRPLVLAGLSTFLIGCMAMIGATILDGFVSIDVAAAFANAPSPESVKQGYNMIALLGIALTDLARLGWILQALASLAWSWTLLGKPGMARAIGTVGLVSSCLVIYSSAASGANMTMTALLTILLCQALWNFAAATLLIRKKELAASFMPESLAMA